jgi:hypothetical protein
MSSGTGLQRLTDTIDTERAAQERRTIARVEFYQTLSVTEVVPGTPSDSPPSEDEFSPVSVPESPVSASGRWHLVVKEECALIFNRVGVHGTQEWLTGTSLGGGDWDFRHSSEVNTTIRGVRLFDVADDGDDAPA